MRSLGCLANVVSRSQVEGRHAAGVDELFPSRLPSVIPFKAGRSLFIRATEHVFVLDSLAFGYFQLQELGVEPNHFVRPDFGEVPPRADTYRIRLVERHVEHSRIAEFRTAASRASDLPSVIGRVKRVVERAQPTVISLVLLCSNAGDDQ